jgi:NADPH2:quinone reductase
MKAAVYYQNGGPEVLRYEDVPDPVCAPDGVLVDVEVVSLEGGDLLSRALTPLTQRPYIVGYQCAGTVCEVGANVRNRKLGDRVVALSPNGSHAERVAASAATTWLVPPGGDLLTLGCVPVAFGAAHEALFELGQLKPGQRVLIHAGAGGVGLAAIQFAKGAGAEVLTTASSDAKLAKLRELGAAHTINYKERVLKDAVRDAVGPDGVDLVVDPVGGKVLQESVECLRYRGKIVSLGLAGRELAGFNPVPLWFKNGTLLGLGIMASLQYEYGRFYGTVAQCIERVHRGELRVMVDKCFALRDASRAHAHVEQGAAFGRVVLLPRG